MENNSFTSGPIRPLSLKELGVDMWTDYELLSDSGHNLVYRVQADGKWFVLKAAKQDEGELTRNRLLLEREFEIMHRLDSIYVVHTIAMVDDHKLGRAILMEYVNGRSLEQFVAEKPSSSERRRVADELMETLAFLHDRQIVHGDLKPSNILITRSGNHVCLIDFGFADNEAYIAKNIGTSPSISKPEQLPSDILLPERDIYALGKILSLLFPHSAKPVIRRCLASTGRKYISVHQVQSALHRYWRLRWLIPLALCIITAVTLLITFLPQPVTPLPVEVQKDTVIVISQPAVDSTWLNLKSRAERQYATLYRTYADSIKRLPEKSYYDAMDFTSRYARKMLQTRDKLAKSNPQYEEQLYDQYMFIYNRDLPRLYESCKVYY